MDVFALGGRSASAGSASNLISIASNNIRYSDTTSYSVATASASNRVTPFYRFVPKALGEVVMSLDASISTGTGSVRVLFPVYEMYGSNAMNLFASGSTAINSTTPLGTVTTVGSTNTTLQGISQSLATVSTTTPQTLTFTLHIVNFSPIFIAIQTAVSATVTASNFKASYDLV
jgi:hypothetical protein